MVFLLCGAGGLKGAEVDFGEPVGGGDDARLLSFDDVCFLL